MFWLQKLKRTINLKNPFRKTLTEKSGSKLSKYFLTTPIFYVNASPHIGHLYTAVIGDAAIRFQRLKNPDLKTKFMVGTDEHGLKVSQSAAANKTDIKTFCDNISSEYKSLFEVFSIKYDNFIRTTEEKHIKAATALWDRLSLNNFIYSGKYSGWYCLADEMFVSEQYLDSSIGENGERYTLEGRPVYFAEEVNYKFKLNTFQNDLLHWLKDDVVKPKKFKDILVSWIEEGSILNDISISRPSARVSWGIPVPGDSSQTLYVWLDALSSYLCSNGYPDSSFKWPPDVQIVGKDILRFHGVFWPAFLIAADLEPPKCIFCHSHWLVNDEKMSKSKGNVVDPFKCSDKITSEGLRYFLLRGGVPHDDGNFDLGKVTAYLNSELANSLGNLLMRCTGEVINPDQIFPSFFEDSKKYFDEACEELVKILEDLPEKVTAHFDEFHFYKGIDDIMTALHSTNKFFNTRTPWNSKDTCKNSVNLTLHLTMESLRCCGILLQPIIPNISATLLNKLSIPKSKRNLNDIRPFSWEQSKTQQFNLMPEKVQLFHKVQR